MERITITIDDELLSAIDILAGRRGYPSRSEAIRELTREAVRLENTASGSGACMATLSYVYDHETRDLSERLIEQQHAQHDLGVATMHVHLDHESCLEVAILRGPIGRVRDFADHLTVQRGVRHSSLHIVPLKAGQHAHSHAPGSPKHKHSNL